MSGHAKVCSSRDMVFFHFITIQIYSERLCDETSEQKKCVHSVAHFLGVRECADLLITGLIQLYVAFLLFFPNCPSTLMTAGRWKLRVLLSVSLQCLFSPQTLRTQLEQILTDALPQAGALIGVVYLLSTQLMRIWRVWDGAILFF